MKKVVSRPTVFLTTLSVMLVLSGCKGEKKADATPAEETAPNTAMEQQAPQGPELSPISHATAVLAWGGTVIYIDPVGGAEAFAGQPEPDLILITDVHGDHYSAETLEALPGAGAKIVAPEAVAKMLPAALEGRVTVLANGDTQTEMGIAITGIPMYNLREEALKFHEKGRGNGYVLEKDGTRVYISGDTEDIPEMRALQDIDMALVCMNLPYTMTVDRAADAVLEFRPARVYPYHYRGNPEVSDVSQFKALVEAGNPEIEVVQLDWYPNAAY
ncbi:MBL fold metallo-hydrolase [Robiginitalea sp. M366]|uniref:MBL fold metallo-hydrolase n=1 Tax=Robiginitalea aestuariiviva TaxID=3036903 RepID=UPI00240D7180|nr:MBL fold metallo-hydrolase [Robiginitalea aestuariiviva]MDG1573056.1 MBL fold metallo-hydrolase [Robiginitalea aestuariiviva]